MADWRDFEDKVKKTSSYIWNRPAKPEHIDGIDYDCVLDIDEYLKVVVEVTINNSLDKIRGDINRLQILKVNFVGKGVVVRPYIICGFEPSTSMRETARSAKIEIMSYIDFTKLFFNFDHYKNTRELKQFGSAIDPVTGKADNTEFIPVTYTIDKSNKKITLEEISLKLQQKKKIILLGDYGTGKSRCFKELFKRLSAQATEKGCYPIAINLKDTWGLENSFEILNRHIQSLGLPEEYKNNVIKSFGDGNFSFLLDGFDEVGSRPWSEDRKKLEDLRRISLQGVKDLITNCDGGIIISGREHYFNKDQEMFSALGIKQEEAIIIRCKDEFDLDEFRHFISNSGVTSDIPIWVPKKPLILKIISSLPKDEIDNIFNGDDSNSIVFWRKFIDLMCERDAKIHGVLDGETIKEVLRELAFTTRLKPYNMGPISESEIVEAFRVVTNSHPNEQATVMLQRLPGLGRVSAESGDRNFIDEFILDGLRAIDLLVRIDSNDRNMLNLKWINPLKKLGLMVLYSEIENKNYHSACIDFINRSTKADRNNKIAVSDVLSSLISFGQNKINFDNLCINEAHISFIDLSRQTIEGLKFSNSIFEEVLLGKIDPPNVSIENSDIELLHGVSSKLGIPSWFKENVDVKEYSSVDTLTSIKSSGLNVAQTMLVSILMKVYMQAGNGRLEHTLVKGLTQSQIDKKLLNRVLTYLVSNEYLYTSKDRGETIYKPNRKIQGRVERIITELDRSNDEIWEYARSLK